MEATVAFSFQSYKELWGFGWKLLVSGILDSVWRELNQVVIGKCYNSATLGYYTRASQFSSLFSSNITAVVQRVSFPVLSSIQDDVVKLKLGYKKVIKVTMLPTCALMFGLAACSESLIYVLLGNKWMNCVPMLQILCLYMFLDPLHSLNLNAIQVMGRSDLTLKLKIIKIILSTIPLAIGIFIGIYWMLIGSVFVNILSYYLNAYYSKTLLNYSIKEQVVDVLPSFLISLIMALIVYTLSFIPISMYIILPIQIVSGIFIEFLLCERIKSDEYVELKSIVISALKKVKHYNMVKKNLITVTSPLLPNLDELNVLLRQIWDSKWITNNGQFHKQLEHELAKYLGVPYISLFTNGTLPLLTALQAFRITGEVITTPYSFVATTHSIWWNGCKPVFVDIDPTTGNIDPDNIEAAITPKLQLLCRFMFMANLVIPNIFKRLQTAMA